MTVKQLIEKLSTMPQDTVVTMSNSSIFHDGEFEVTDVYFWNWKPEYGYENSVEIQTNHVRQVDIPCLNDRSNGDVIMTAFPNYIHSPLLVNLIDTEWWNQPHEKEYIPDEEDFDDE